MTCLWQVHVANMLKASVKCNHFLSLFLPLVEVNFLYSFAHDFGNCLKDLFNFSALISVVTVCCSISLATRLPYQWAWEWSLLDWALEMPLSSSQIWSGRHVLLWSWSLWKEVLTFWPLGLNQIQYRGSQSVCLLNLVYIIGHIKDFDELY